jgi:hypothetical protein
VSNILCHALCLKALAVFEELVKNLCTEKRERNMVGHGHKITTNDDESF